MGLRMRSDRGTIPSRLMMPILTLIVILGVSALMLYVISLAPHMMTGFGWFLLSAGFLLALMVYSLVLGLIRRRQSGLTPGPARFMPHWRIMLFLGFSLFAMLAAIIIPLTLRLLSR
jgi:hypothetical protein